VTVAWPREALLRAATYATAAGSSSRWPAGSAEAALQRACPAGERRSCGRRATAPSTSPQALLRAAGHRALDFTSGAPAGGGQARDPQERLERGAPAGGGLSEYNTLYTNAW
jgi:hypothetical protein